MVRCVRDWGCLSEHTTLYLSCILHLLHSSTPLPYHRPRYSILFIPNLHISTQQLYLITALLSAHSSPTFLTTVPYYVAPHSPAVLRCTRTSYCTHLHSVNSRDTAYYTKPSLLASPITYNTDNAIYVLSLLHSDLISTIIFIPIIPLNYTHSIKHPVTSLFYTALYHLTGQYGQSHVAPISLPPHLPTLHIPTLPPLNRLFLASPL